MGFIATIVTLKYYKLANSMTSLPYHHLPNGTFRNLPGSPTVIERGSFSTKRFFYFLYKGLIKREMFGQKEVPDKIPSDHVITKEKALNQFNNNSDKYSITWLGHASFLIKMNKHIILTDPYLSKTAGPLGIGPNRYIPAGINVKNLPKINTILISHNHYDHLDTVTLRRIKNKKDINIICPLNLSKIISDIGFKKIIELDWYEKFQQEKISFTSVPAYHWSRRLGRKRNSSLWSGYTISDNSKKIYFSGDTAFGSMFKEIGKKLGPFDLTIVSIGAYEPRQMMQSSHCNPEEAVEITKMLRSKNILSMHWGTIRLSAEDPWEPPKRFNKKAKTKGYLDHQIWKLAIGQTKSLI
tara:strand:- start:7559 stop:8620 length:1062 start_codon:yes stop_codon:yes gene_type:complete